MRIGGRGQVKVLDGGLLTVGGAALLGGGGAGTLDVTGVNAGSGDRRRCPSRATWSSAPTATPAAAASSASSRAAAPSSTTGSSSAVSARDGFAIIDGLDRRHSHPAGRRWRDPGQRGVPVLDHGGGAGLQRQRGHRRRLARHGGGRRDARRAVLGRHPHPRRRGAGWTTGLLALCPDGLVTVGDRSRSGPAARSRASGRSSRRRP